MLGMDSKELPVVEGKYATEMREALKRAYLGQPNDFEREVQARAGKISKEYEVVWK